MNAKVENQVTSSGDNLKFLVSIIIVVASIAGFYHFSESSLLMRVIALCLAAALVVAIMLKTAVGQNILNFAIDSKIELRKVIWPTKQETTQTTMVVLVMVMVMALLLWGLDSILQMIIKWLLH